MNRKDRIAIVISGIYFLLPLMILFKGKGEGFIILSVPLALYWGYRFIKNDISFLNNKGDA